MTKNYRIVGFGIALLCILLDQLSKWAILYPYALLEKGSVELLPFFNLTMVWNYGISFGMFSSRDPMNAYLLSGMAMIIVGWLLVWMWRTSDRCLVLGQAMVIGGALGNVIDRLVYGAVADFFDVHVAGYHWPAFNVADSTIFLGVVILLWDGTIRAKESS